MNTESEKYREPLMARMSGLLWHHGLPLFIALLGTLAALAPLTHGDSRSRIGFLLVVTALLEMTHGFRRSTVAGQKAAWYGGAISLALGLLLMNASSFAGTALRIFLAGWFGFDGLRSLTTFITARTDAEFRIGGHLGPALINLSVALTVLLLGDQWLTWGMAIAAAYRILGTSWAVAESPVFTVDMLADANYFTPGLSQDVRVNEIVKRVADEEVARTVADRGWIFSFLLTLLAIHVGRMGFDRTFLGLMSPGFAVLGDMFAGLLLAFLVVVPVLAATNRLTRRLEAATWLWCVSGKSGRRGLPGSLIQSILTFRLRQLIRLRQARCSYSMALGRGLQVGLPLAAIIAATVPVWGMSWYFDTENWAAGIWNSWAEHRTDTWRASMVKAVASLQSGESADRQFSVTPDGVQSDADFSFIVIGDPGEGDASQLSLKSQLLEVAGREDVRFVVISSDVVYPTGAMKDYEANFWLPFMGTRKPVYAIPGNHDWYDALEGFTATFFEPEAARAAMRARVETDNNITSTTESRIDELIAHASRLQAEYGVPTQRQRAPYFQLQTDSFALFAVDTGVSRRIDDDQWAWLEAALKAAANRTKMVILGHPFFAGGTDQTVGPAAADFVTLRSLLYKYRVSVVMAGDTHDLEYYREPGVPESDAQIGHAKSPIHSMHHFVNGGGGAYLSFGTALAWPDSPVTPEWAFFPNPSSVVSKIELTAPLWKRPAWFWTQRFGGWPFSAEWLSAAFDVNAAPFYQSFVEVRVEPSMNRLRLIPYGVHGRLKYKDFQLSQPVAGSNWKPEADVEWAVPFLNQE